MVGDHQSVKRRLGIWLRPDLWALVSFLYFIDSSKPLAFSQKRPSQVGKYVPARITQLSIESDIRVENAVVEVWRRVELSIESASRVQNV